MWSTDDTIAAIASPPQQGLRSIVRVSGPKLRDCLQAVFCSSAGDPWRANSARRWEGKLRLPPPLGTTSAAMIYWPDRRSYTRQPSAEFHLPGAAPIADACLEMLCRHGARLAKPGEFTMRAFLAGRIDLTQAEAVLGVIDAQSEAELQVALQQLAGNLSKPLADARERLLAALSHLEAGLDFVDEDIEFITKSQLEASVRGASEAVAGVLRQIDQRSQADRPPRIVIYGQPNSGKSSLFNCIAGSDQAIVSPVAGTTRDYLALVGTWHGRQLEWIDTAGFDPTLTEQGDAKAQSLGNEQLDSAAVAVLCVDLSREVSDWERRELADCGWSRIVVGTKTDLVDLKCGGTTAMIKTCSVTGSGVEQLTQEVVKRVGSSLTGGELVASTVLRSRESLQRADECLRRAAQLANADEGEELVAMELRTALDQLGGVAGELHHDEVLDRVFRQFCIGK